MDERNDVPRPPGRIDLRDGAFLRLLVPDDDSLVFTVVDRERERLRRWLPWVDVSREPADTRAFIERTIASDGREFAYGIFIEEEFAGAIGLHPDPSNRSAMIGYWIDAAHEGRGLVTEASRALTDVAFGDLSMHRVWLSADPTNTRSCAVAERLGFRREGVHRGDALVDGEYRDTVVYAILEDEWRSAGGS